MAVGDGFLLWTPGEPTPGDVVTFRAERRDQPVTHRIVERTPEGFVTRGDGNPTTDQATGHSHVRREEVVGTVVTVGGDPLVVPGIGRVVRLAGTYRVPLVGLLGVLLLGRVAGGDDGPRERSVTRAGGVLVPLLLAGAVDDAAVLATRDDDSLVDVRLRDSVVFERLAESDARLRSFVVADGTATVAATFPGSVDVRSLLEAIGTGHDGVELLARRERERSVETPRTLRARLETDLTDRQRQVLRTAHEAGYFRWPRDITGEGLAEVFDVEPPTLHYHMRAAQRKLVAAVFDPRKAH